MAGADTAKMEDGDASPAVRLGALLARNLSPTATDLVLMLEVLQQLAVGQIDPAVADGLFQRLTLAALDADGAVLGRLMEEPRTAHLPASTRQALASLRAQWTGRAGAARAVDVALPGPGAGGLELIIAGRRLLRQNRMTEALAAFQRAGEQPAAAASAAVHLSAVEQFLMARLDLSPPPPGTARPLLTLCAALRNEAPHVAEWVAYHSLVGVDRFCLYENESTDDTRQVLRRLARRYDIEVVDWKRQPANATAFDDCLRRGGRGAQWVACLDADEFLMPAEEESVRDLLRRVPADVAAVTANWRIFGSSGHRDRPRLPTLAAYVHRAAHDFPANRHVKSIVRPERALAALNAHHFLTLGRQVDGALAPSDALAGCLLRPRYVGLWVNHYIVRSREDYALKRARGRPEVEGGPNRWVHDSFFEDFDRNEVPDPSAQRFLPALEAALAAL
jgi:hypothetical protein